MRIIVNFIIVWTLFFPTLSQSRDLNCSYNIENFNDYTLSLQSCFDQEFESNDFQLNKILVDKKTNFLDKSIFDTNSVLSLSNNHKEFLNQLSKQEYKFSYGIHLEFNELLNNKTISKNIYKEITNLYYSGLFNSFNEIGRAQTLGFMAVISGFFAQLYDLAGGPNKTIDLSISTSSILENSSDSVTLTATASEAVMSETTVSLTVAGDATSGTDYTISSTSITIPAGSTTGSVTISLTDDSIYEGNESILLSISSISDIEFSANSSASLTITENESAPSITLGVSSTSILENSGSSLTLTVSSSQVSDEDITISLDTAGTSTEGTDYSSLSDLTISAGQTSKTANFTPTDDSIYEGDETAIISIGSVSGSDASESGSQSKTITITENESAPTVTLAVSATTIAENAGSSLTLTATLSGKTDADITVALDTAGTATEGTDYTDGSGAVDDIIISAGDTTGTVSFTPTDDSFYDATSNETATISINGVTGKTGVEENSTPQAVTITITDNESAPTVTLTSSASSVSEDGSALTLTATLSNGTYADTTITLSTGGTATEGTDYANLSDIVVTAGSATGTTSLTPTDDSTFEGDETITVDIDSVSGGSASENGTQQVSITFQEDDAGPTLTIADVITADESAANASVTVTLTPASGLSATVDYATSNGTATAGADYTAASGTLTFAAGDTTKTISVPILADTTDENDETITVTLSNAVRSTIDDATATITITDDDNPPSLSINDVTTADETAGNATFTVSLSAASAKEITVAYATSDGTATAGSDYTSSSGTLTFDAGDTTKTFTVPVLADSTDENNETVTLTLSSASNASISDATGTLTITDDDSAPSLSINDVSSTDESNVATSLTVTLSAASGKDITVDYATSNGTATAGSDYTAASGTLTFSAGDTTKTIDVTTLTDSVVEGNETVTITLSNPSNASISDSTGTFTITDDDSSTFSVADVTAAEDAGTATITVTATNVFSSDVTIDYATSNGTATAGSDYTAASGTLTLSAGDTTKTFTVTISDDSTDENSETATITISNASSGSISDATATLTITDNDDAPSLSINDVTTADETAGNATFTVSLSAASGKEITVAYATSDGTASAGSDYTSSSGTLTFDAGDTTKTFTVPVLADSTDENNETVTLTLSSASNASISDATGTLTITDDDSAPSLSINDISADEDGTTGTFTVSLSAASGKDITVDYATSDGTATAGSDYTATSGTLTISAGNSSGVISVTILDDSTFEGDETVTMSLSNASNSSISDSSGTLTIAEDDDGPTLTIADVITADESAANASVTVTLTPASGLSATVDYATSNGTATAGADYTAASGTLTFAAGDTTKTISVPILADTTDENDETITVTLSNAVRSTIDDATATITITDDDNPPSLSINDVTTADETAGNATFTVSLSAASAKEITVAYATSDGTATAGSDYTSSSGTLTFDAGDTTKTFTVPVLADSTDENNETVTLTLSSASNASISDATGTLTITDDDSAPSLSINDVSSTDESNVATSLTVTLSAASGKDITVDYATSNGTATAGSDYTAASGTLTFSAGDTTKTIDVTTLTDSVVEGNETVTITLSNPSNASISDSTGTFTITDDDSSTFSVADVTAAEDAGTATITVTATNVFSSDVTIDYATSNGTATAGSDYTAASGTLTLSAGDTTKTFTVTISDDSTDENSETATITISNASSGSISDATATLTITDNDDAPSLSINDVTTADEGDGSTNMTVSLSAASGKEITVDYATSDVTAEAGSDYTAASGTLTFAAGDTSKTIGVTVTDDLVYEGDETLTMTLFNPSNATLNDATGTFTVTDDESAPTVTLTTSAANIAENAGTSLTLTATLSNATDEDVTVALATAGTATEGTDYSNISDITITAGSLTGTASFTPTDDSTFETSTDETATVSISTVSGGSATESGSQSVTITINEDDSAPTVTLSTSNTTIAENSGSTLTLTATLTNPTYEDVTVSLGTSGTATEGTDYANISDITISAGSITGTATFDPTDDSDETDTLTAIVAITAVSGGDATESGSQSVTISITDDESVPRVSLTVSSNAIAENAGSSLTLTATLSKTAAEDVVVTLSTSGTATEGTDYGNLSNITVSAGALTGTTTFTPTDDTLYDASSDETAVVAIDTVSGGGALENGTQSVTITITDNESAPTVTLSRASSSIDENSSSTVTLTATLSVATYEDVTVALAASGGTEGTDYENVSDITISAGSTTGTSALDPIDDNVFEDDETVTISIDSVSDGGATESGSQSVTITITDDETAPTVTLSISASSIAENAGSSLTITATLSGETDEIVTVALDTSGTATEGTDYTDGSGAIDNITINAGLTTGTVNFTPTDDSTYEGNETAIISIGSVSGGGATENSIQSETIIIIENESAPTVSLTVSASSINENAGSSLTITATLSGAADEDVVVSIGTAGTSTEGTDYTDGDGELDDITISANSTTGTINFTPTDDTTYEGNETAIISIVSVTGADATEFESQSETITITENESAPTVTLAVSNTSIAENAGSSLTLTATLSGTTDATITVALDTSGTATEGTDYTDGDGVIDDITISAGSTTGTVSFTPTDDSIYDASSNETATISINGVTGKTGVAENSTPQAVTITIVDNESAPTVTLTTASNSIAENSSDTITLTATLSHGTYDDVTVQIDGTGGTGTEGSDFASVSDITISAGDTTGTVSFDPTNDDIYEGNETAGISVSGVLNGGATESGSQAVTITITDDESVPTVTLTADSYSIAENSGSVIELTATLSGKTDSNTTITFLTSGTATEGLDYVNLLDIVISAGSLSDTTIFVPDDEDVADPIYEGDETAIIDIDTVLGDATENGTQQVTLTITDNETAPTVTLSASSNSIAENSGSTILLTALLSGKTYADVTVSIDGTGGTAIEGTDFAAVSDITISAGDLSGIAEFDPTDDASDPIYEGDETAVIAISSVNGGEATEDGDQSETITITENESAPTVSLSTSSNSIAENNGGSLTLTATLTGKVDVDTTVTLSTSGTATEGTDYSSLSSIIVTAEGLQGTTTFTPLDDASDPVFEEDETAIIAINTVSGDVTENGVQSETITITENESVTVTLSGTTSIDEKTETATITATASVKADASMTISLNTAGTATSGTDYTALSNISISAGSTSGTTTLTPTNDTNYEGGSETAVISINAITGVTATGAADTVTITITNEALNSGTQKTYNSTLASNIASSAEYTNIEFFNSNKASEDSPYETINLAEALGYGDYGAGQTIAIVDSQFLIGCVEGGVSYTHQEFSGKTIDSYGTITCPFVDGEGNIKDHGTAVASIAAGVDNSGSGILGVASQADLHISDYTNNGSDNPAVHWKNLTDDASGAIVQNNSWGYDYSVADAQSYMTTNSLSASQALSAALSWGTVSEVDDYISSLNSFQNNGVIVFALSNDSTMTGADISAGLPEFYPQLQEAWISAVNIDKTGSSGSYTYTLKSAPCGETAEYCLGGDGWNITAAAEDFSTVSAYQNTFGTSFVAPQISGAVALLGNHFPNHTPEQIVDRLLASADNTWLTSDGTVTFGNGVQHSYSEDYGHGLMDIYAALQPITSNSFGRSIYTGAKNIGGLRYELGRSYIAVGDSRSRAFGDSINQSLKSKTSYFYDALGGGFEYEVSGHVVQEFDENVIDLKSEIKAIGSEYNGNTITFNSEKYSGSYFDKDLGNSRIIGSLTSAPPALQAFFDTNNNLLSAHIDTNTSYLTSKEGGYGFSVIEDLTDGTSISYGFNTPFMNSQEESEVQRGQQTIGFISTETEITENQVLSFIIGNATEEDNFLGLKGEGAYSFENTNSDTNFTGVKLSSLIDENKKLSLMATMGESSMDIPSGMMVTGANNVKSSSYSIQYSQNNILGNDQLALNIDQPNRVEDGTIGIKLTNLSDSDGNLSYRNESVEIKPSGRQINLGIGYQKEINDDLIISAKILYTQDNNHIKGNDSNSYFIGSKYKDLRLGMTQSSNSDAEMRFEYNYNF